MIYDNDNPNPKIYIENAFKQIAIVLKEEFNLQNQTIIDLQNKIGLLDESKLGEKLLELKELADKFNTEHNAALDSITQNNKSLGENKESIVAEYQYSFIQGQHNIIDQLLWMLDINGDQNQQLEYFMNQLENRNAILNDHWPFVVDTVKGSTEIMYSGVEGTQAKIPIWSDDI